jgi:sigma-E factor negative regulatory protein RseB
MRFYSIELAQTERIAGRRSQRVDVIPRDKLRYTHSFWIDVENGMLLKYALYDGQGEVIEWFMFTHIEFPTEIPLSRFKPEIQEKDFIWYQNDKNGEESTAQVELNQWQAVNLPPGFEQLQHRRQYKYPDPRPIEHLVFSDGMSTVSVFIEKLAPEEEPVIGPKRIGAISTYGQVVDGYQVTAVGEVPMATVMAISNSIQKG